MSIDCTGQEYLMIQASGLFDERYYRRMAQLDPSLDALSHYLEDGWRTGVPTSPEFDGVLLGPYFESVGFTGPPLLTFAMLKAAGWAVFPNRNDLEASANVLRSNVLFDDAYYRQHSLLNRPELDSAFHYLIVGEKLGLAPSTGFDQGYYTESFPDIRNAGLNCLVHFILFGQREGRRPRPLADENPLHLEKFSSLKETLIIVSHEATRTGAPILALNISQQLVKRYNLVVILLQGGALVDDFVSIASHLIVVNNRDRNDAELKYFVRNILRSCRVHFAIVNSIESRDIIRHMAEAFVPVILLMHEFASYTRPLTSVCQAFGWATDIVFSTQLTLESAVSEHPGLVYRDCKVIPQGVCDLSGLIPNRGSKDEFMRLKKAMRPEGVADAWVVLGAGSLHFRKGIDLFLMTAAEVLRRTPEIRVRFVWIGHGYRPDRDVNYSVYIREQIVRSGLTEQVAVLDEVTDLGKAYALADAFFLSSRLDPLPNVGIDASIRGLPIICFDDASGVAEILKRDPIAGITVVPYLDVQGAAAAIVNLATDPVLRQRVSDATEALGRKTFVMDKYVGQLEDVGRRAVDAAAQRFQDFNVICNDPLFDEGIFLSVQAAGETRVSAIKRYLCYWSATMLAANPLESLPDFRRPVAGFHPQLYAQHHDTLLETGINPLSDFIRRGYPDGPWLHTVFRPNLSLLRSRVKTHLRVAVHGHFHYPDLIEDFLAKLRSNEHPCDLLLSTNTEAKADRLEAATSDFDRGRVVIRVVPNRGRDIGPLLTAFRQEIRKDYDVVGHFHSKRSLSVDARVGEIWREFLWNYLIGDIYPMMDFVLARFAEDDRLGMLFAEEPHLVGWSNNIRIAEVLATRMGVILPLPRFHEFPVGTMFWARSDALAPIFNLDLSWDDYPEEPIADDGTILHALERLLPLAAQHAKFGFATTYIEGISR
jgi:glycosyltransferase involved in cell wall biosynthesis